MVACKGDHPSCTGCQEVRANAFKHACISYNDPIKHLII